MDNKTSYQDIYINQVCVHELTNNTFIIKNVAFDPYSNMYFISGRFINKLDTFDFSWKQFDREFFITEMIDDKDYWTLLKEIDDNRPLAKVFSLDEYRNRKGKDK